MAGKRWAYIPAYWKFNLAILLEYRASFASQALAMALNDGLWVVFWGLYFTKFPTVAGWGFSDVLTVWSVVAVGYGLMAALAGNVFSIPEMVVGGQLDFFLGLPKPVLPHLLVSRMSTMAWGDVLFGVAVFLAFVARTWQQVAAFAVAASLAAVIMTSFGVIAGSLSFFFGHAEQASRLAMNALVNFSTYPLGIYDRMVRILLYTAVPAGLVSALPVAFIRTFSLRDLGIMCGAAGLMAGLAWGVFHAGLRRYESGNLMSMRS